jgi:glutathione S-transferase
MIPQQGRARPISHARLRSRWRGYAHVHAGPLRLRRFGELLVGNRYTIADIAVFGYVHVAHEAGYDLNSRPAVQAWLRRVAAQDGYVNDLLPYPPNARPGAGRSIYD